MPHCTAKCACTWRATSVLVAVVRGPWWREQHPGADFQLCLQQYSCFISSWHQTTIFIYMLTPELLTPLLMKISQPQNIHLYQFLHNFPAFCDLKTFGPHLYSVTRGSAKYGNLWQTGKGADPVCSLILWWGRLSHLFRSQCFSWTAELLAVTLSRSCSFKKTSRGINRPLGRGAL